jgi:integrase
MNAKITNDLIKTLKPQAKPYEVYDTEVKGFILRVQPSGTMTYICRYAEGRRMTLGPTSLFKVLKARDWAKDKLSEYRATGVDPMETRKAERSYTLQSYIDEKYKPWAETHLKSSGKWLHAIGRYLPDLGDKKLPEITPWLIEKHRSARLKAGVTAATANRNMTALKAALNKAVEWGVIKSNPLAAVKKMKEDRSPNVRYLNADEDKRLHDALDAREAKRRQDREKFNEWRRQRGYEQFPTFGTFTDHLKPITLTALNTGMRRGELFNAKWTDINFVSRILTVMGKTAKSLQTRHIPLNDEVFEVLQKWYEQRKDSELVFPSHDGGRMDNISTSWERLMKDAKIENFRFHDCRHDFASKLVMAGVDLNTVRELLGHSDIKMTLRYAHLAPQKLAAAVAKLGR